MKKSSKKKSGKNKKRRRREEDDEEDEECEWLQRTCVFPLGESENMPSGCNPRCRARMQNNRIAEHRRIDNRSMYQ